MPFNDYIYQSRKHIPLALEALHGSSYQKAKE